MKIDTDILSILETASATPAGIVIPGRLDPKTYARVNKVLTATGWKWNRQAGAHVHPVAEPAEALESMLETGEVVRLADFGFFETAGPALDRVIELADLTPGLIVLEPSAGTGNIVRRALAAGCYVAANDLLAVNVEALSGIASQQIEITHGDFLAMTPRADCDRVVMNPPFAKQVDLEHVLHAISFLKPGGKLVSVMSAGVRFRENAKTQAFHAAIEALSPGWENLPDGSFKASGTNVNTCILSLVKS